MLIFFSPLVSMLQYAGYLETEGSYTFFETFPDITTVQSLLV